MKKTLAVIAGLGLLFANAYATSHQKTQPKTGKQAKMQTTSETNKAKGQAFLAENKKKPGVVETPSGLQYKIIKNGNGPKPKFTDSVTVHYAGTLINGTEFDSSYKRNSPATFGLQQVIAGWTEGLQLMNVGSKCMLYIPSDLGYGDNGNPRIPGGSTLIFEVELLDIIK